MATTGTMNQIVSGDRCFMKVYVARDYIDKDYRKTDMIEVNLPEYLPTVPMDDQYTETVATPEYFKNTNWPITTGETIRSIHYMRFPIMNGTYAPIRMRKGTEFMLCFPTGKVDEGRLIFMRHKDDIELEEKEEYTYHGKDDKDPG